MKTTSVALGQNFEEFILLKYDFLAFMEAPNDVDMGL